MEGFSIADDLILSIGGSPDIFGPVEVTIPAAAFVIADGKAEATVPFGEGEVHVSFSESGTGSFQINVDASGLNDCSTGVAEATLTLSLGGGESSLTLARGTDSKFRGDDSDGDGYSDAEELSAGSNPNDAGSMPGGGAAVTAVPALSTWGMALLVALVAGATIWMVQRQRATRA